MKFLNKISLVIVILAGTWGSQTFAQGDPIVVDKIIVAVSLFLNVVNGSRRSGPFCGEMGRGCKRKCQRKYYHWQQNHHCELE